MRIGVALLAVGLFAQTAKEQAFQFYQQQRFKEAATLYEQHMAAHPDDRSAALLLGLAWQQSGLLPQAEAQFTRLKAPYFLARVQFLRGRFAEALASADDALAGGESADRVWQLRGRIEEERGNLELAATHYGRATSPEGRSGLASVLYKLGRYPEARTAALAAQNAEGQQILKKIAQAPSLISPDPVVLPRFSVQDLPFTLAHSPTAAKHLVSTMAGGLAAADFDGDGLVDLFFPNGADPRTLKKNGPQHANVLLLNRGPAGWKPLPVAGDGFSIGTAVGDFDNDGDPDLFVAGAGRNLLYRNDHGKLTLIPSAIADEPFSVAAVWFDYDRDGWLDLFVVNYLAWSPANNKFCGDQAKGLRVYCNPREFAPQANRLYRNRHDGTFEDVSARSGISKHLGKGMSVAAADFDADGWLDLFVTNDGLPNFLFRNRGDGTFSEVGLESGVALSESGQPVSSMGAITADFDRDGRPDLLFTALVRETFPLFRNLGAGRFQDVSFPAKLGPLTLTRSGWGAVFGDFNNDGWPDLLTANSHVTDNIAAVSNEVYEETSTVFVQSRGVFLQALPVTPKGAWRGAVVADFDNDGRLDAVLTRLGAPAVFLHNITEPAGRSESKPRPRLLPTACGYASSCAGPIHVGLGQNVPQ
ncbi:MAG: FG-GAP-like repeat-containing protein [Acidobacteria bacterium]|nr:FG-GAP-like repeat-containing protein [Acidobacteriota bacterium]